VKLTASHLRKNLASILDQVAESGVPVEIEPRGGFCGLSGSLPSSTASRSDLIVGNFEDLIHMGWSKGMV
jgi:hypothetical protein